MTELTSPDKSSPNNFPSQATAARTCPPDSSAYPTLPPSFSIAEAAFRCARTRSAS